ncbi:hypothetical protein [Streptomyces hundungensis]|uniref:hypothetical protein n=1 Tax=Streptomyces hundungensis TaxID=1077946 RepID=UPI001FE97BAC|nr:hypothetical protein [Streptomyces hundungensis]
MIITTRSTVLPPPPVVARREELAACADGDFDALPPPFEPQPASSSEITPSPAIAPRRLSEQGCSAYLSTTSHASRSVLTLVSMCAGEHTEA